MPRGSPPGTGKDPRPAVGNAQTGFFKPNDMLLEKYWREMPEYESNAVMSYDSVVVHFRNRKDKEEFFRLIGQKPGGGRRRTHPIWFPEPAAEVVGSGNRGKRFEPEKIRPGKHPIYVISKGRWESRLTAKSLEKLGLPYRIVIEPQEHKQYRRVIGRDKILVLPFSNLGQGSIPARNWVWEHAISEGHERHWILDDNIDGFFRLNRNMKMKVTDENPFVPIEEWVDRYENVGIAGMNYFMFAPRKTAQPALYLNTRVYSCILIRNDLTHRWRGRYNEDTDLCLRVLKEKNPDGSPRWCTVLFNAYLILKQTTMTMAGGNTDELYKQDEEVDGRRLMAESLKEQHPDVVTVTHKWGRWQHQVDYRPFKKNQLIER